MTGPAGNWHRAWRRHLRICREEAWGQCPADPAWQAVPLFGDGCTLRASNPHFSPETLFGGFRRSLHLSHVQLVEGELVALPWPEVTLLLMEMALGDETGVPRSYCADLYTPADPRRWLGLMVERLDISVRQGERDVLARLGLKGEAEEPNPALSESDFDYSAITPVPFTFDRATLSVDGTAITDAEAFALRLENDLSEGPNRLGRVAFLLPGKRAVSLELQGLDDSGAANEAVRQDLTLSFGAVFTHPAGHTFSIELPVLHAQSNREDAPPGELARTVLRLDAATDEQGREITWSVQLSS